MQRESLVGLAMAGLIMGALVAVLIGERPHEAPMAHMRADLVEPQGDLITAPGVRSQADVANDAPIHSAVAKASTPKHSAEWEAVLERLTKAHTRIHQTGQEQAKAQGLPAALVNAIKKDKWLRELRLEVHRSLGADTFFEKGSLTPFSSDLVSFLKRVAAHGLDPSDYGMPKLSQRLKSFLARSQSDGPRPPEAAGHRGAQLMALLKTPHLTREAAYESLRSGGAAPALAEVDAATRAVEEATDYRQENLEQFALEAELGRALLRLTLDMTHVVKVGPLNITKSEAKLFSKRDKRDKLLAQLNDLTTGTDEKRFEVLYPKHPNYRPMLAVYERYRKYATSESCSKLPAGWRLAEGARGAEVKRLQQRLACEGYFQGSHDGFFGPELTKAVKAYQTQHDLDAEGVIGPATIKSLNVPMSRRAVQIKRTLQRMREQRTRHFTDRYVKVNIPAYELQLVENDKITRRERVIVGTNKLDDDKIKLIQGHINRTKLFATKLYEVVVNPDWILPERIAKGELKTSVENDPGYLKKQNIREITLENGSRVYVQGRGKTNVLGKVKFLLAKSPAIYIHDTDKRWLFKERRRAYSHGCIRLNKAVGVAKELLLKDGYASSDIDRTFASGVQRGMKLKKPIDFISEYMTVELTATGEPIFLSDIYGYDKAHAKGETSRYFRRWGHPSMRPRWVPLVPGSVVEGWRKAGKPAPRNYDPKVHGG